MHAKNEHKMRDVPEQEPLGAGWKALTAPKHHCQARAARSVHDLYAEASCSRSASWCSPRARWAAMIDYRGSASQRVRQRDKTWLGQLVEGIGRPPVARARGLQRCTRGGSLHQGACGAAAHLKKSRESAPAVEGSSCLARPREQGRPYWPRDAYCERSEGIPFDMRRPEAAI